MSFVQKYLYFLCALVTVFLGFRYALPVVLPFALGGLLALAAEPAVRFATGTLRLPRWAGAGVGVSLTLVILLGLLWLLSSALVREVGVLARELPNLQDTAEQGIELLSSKVLQLSEKMPAGLGQLLSQSVTSVTSGSSALLEQTARRLPGFVGSAVGKMSQGLIGLGTGVLSGFLISARLPVLRRSLSQRLPQRWKDTALPALQRIKRTLGGWLKAQGLLMLITYAIVCLGLLLLGVPYGFIWAFFIAVIDAVPMLGTGTVLLPWALVALLRNQMVQALGLVGIFATAALARSILEPKLIGRHIGLDPLVTLFSMYAGFRFFGLWGLILAPMTAAAIKAALAE